jgi:hypothetical protein
MTPMMHFELEQELPNLESLALYNLIPKFVNYETLKCLHVHELDQSQIESNNKNLLFVYFLRIT